jgi:hypothetical protein
MKDFGTKAVSAFACVLGWLLLFGSGCRAQDLAAMPYRHLIKLAQGENGKSDAESYKMSISSTLGVSPEKIELLLQTGPAPLHLIVDDKGFFEVPNTVTLFAQNPLLVANQPRGTLNISFKLEVPPFDPPKIENGRIKYTKLFEPVIKMQNEVRRVDPTFGLMGKDQFALVIKTVQPIKVNREMGGGDKKVTGSRTYRPIKGVIYMIMEAYMFEDDPMVEIPDKNVQMELQPVSAKDAERIKAAF